MTQLDTRTIEAVAEALRPVIEREADRRAAERTVQIKRTVTARDAKIDEACCALARAVDRHQAALETSLEVGARRELIRAANRLAKVMRGGRP